MGGWAPGSDNKIQVNEDPFGNNTTLMGEWAPGSDNKGQYIQVIQVHTHCIQGWGSLVTLMGIRIKATIQK